MLTIPAVGTKVVLTRASRHDEAGWLGIVTEHQTKRVATVRWETGRFVGAHQTVRIDRLDVVR